MKTLKKKLYAVMSLFLLLPAFTSCDNDKNEPDDPNDGDTPTEDVSAIAGTYSGALGYTVMGFEPGTIDGSYDLKITPEEGDKDEVSVELPACTFTPPITNASAFTIPALSVEGVDVTLQDNVYTLKDDDFSVAVDGTTYTGKIEGTVSGNVATIEYVVRPGRMPMDINFSYTGTLK